MLAEAQFTEAMGRLASGVAVVTTVVDDRPYGTTATAVSSVCAEPPTLLVCMNRDSATGGAVATSGRFALSLLARDQEQLAVRFAVKGDDKFAGVEVEHLCDLPLLPGATAQIACEVSDCVQAGTHWIFIARLLWAAVSDRGPLTYFRTHYGGFS